MTNDKEQKLKAAATEYFTDRGVWNYADKVNISYRQLILEITEFAKSKSAREYWASEQAKEIERLKEEINIHANNVLLLSNERLLFQEENEKMREVIKKDFEKKIISEIECEKQISELKSQLEAKAVDVASLYAEWSKQSDYIRNKKIDTNSIFEWFLPHLQRGKSDAVEFAEWIRATYRISTRNGNWINYDITTEELYQQYLKTLHE